MVNEKLLNFIKLLDKTEYYENYSTKNLTKYKLGGIAKLVVFPSNADDLKNFVLYLEQNSINYFILGQGSNILISDKGYDGVILCTKKLNNITIKGDLVIVECGAKISQVISECMLNSLSGLEFAIGIPASVGGLVALNGGCYNKSIGDKVCYVVTEKSVYNKANCGFGYRTSRFLNTETILSVCFRLTPEELDNIEEKLQLYKGFRKNPKGRSCGSVFRNDTYYAGKVIDEVGLKGYQIGGAKVSEEHANFIIASDNATSSDVYNLIKYIKEKVKSERQIELCEELLYLGEF